MKVKVEQFQCHEHLEFETTRPVTLIVGPNGRGKSAIADAIEFALLGTGTLRGIHKKSDLARLSIRESQHSARVNLWIGDVQIERKMEARTGVQKCRVNGAKYAHLTEAQRVILEAVGTTEARLIAALNAVALLTGTEAARREILFASAAPSLSRERLVAAFAKRGFGGSEVERWIGLILEGGFRAAEQQVRGERTEITRAIRDTRRTPPERELRLEWQGEPLDLVTLDLVKMEARRAALQAELEGAIEQRVRATEGGAQAALEAARRRLASLEAEPPINASEGEAAELAAEAEALRAELAELAAGAREAQKVVDAAGRTMHPGQCPVVRGVECPLTQEAIDAHCGGSEEGEAAKARAVDVLIAAEAREPEARARLNEITRRQSELSRFATQAKIAADMLERARREVADCEREAAEAAPAASEESPGASLAFVRERIERAGKVIEAKRRYDAEHAAYLEGSQRYGELAERHALLEQAVELLAPEGIESEILGEQIDPIRSALADYSDRVRITDASEVEIQDPTGRWRCYVQCSESYRLRMEMAVAHAVASAAGMPFLIVDRFDHLDGPGKSEELESLRRVAGQYPHGVLVLGTQQRAALSPPPFEDVEMFQLTPQGMQRVGGA